MNVGFVVKVALAFNQWIIKISSPLMTSWCALLTLEFACLTADPRFKAVVSINDSYDFEANRPLSGEKLHNILILLLLIM